mgnify:CR=1 FL=1
MKEIWNESCILSPSLICLDMCNLESQIRILEQSGIKTLEKAGIKMLHVDILDGHFSPSMPLGLDTVRQLRAKTDMFFDCHVMVTEQDYFVDELLDIGVDQIVFHGETQPHIDGMLNRIHAKGVKAGVALKPKFTRLFMAKPHVFIGAANPLASRSSITLSDLEPYPRLSYEQGEHNSFYFSEEILSTLDSRKDILVSDRATLFNLLIGLNGYTICSGVINEELNGPNIVAIPLDVDDYMEIGYITHNRVTPGRFAGLYIEALKRRVGVPVSKVSTREPITRIPVSDR